MKFVQNRVNELFDEFVRIRRRFHQKPELGWKEFETTRLITEKLTEWGIEVEDFGLKAGASALIRGAYPGATIAVRGDIDALPMQEESGLAFASENPGVCHACGHDIHATFALFCARILHENRDKLHGNVRILFQPAEEKGDGAKGMIEHGVLTREPKPERIIGAHVDCDMPAGTIGLIKGPSAAGMDQFEVTVHGFGGHSSRPQNFIDPILSAATLIAQLNMLVSREISPFESSVLSVCQIHGGTANNVVPETVTFGCSLRSFTPEVRKTMLDAIERTCKLHCESMRTRAEVKFLSGTAPLVHDEKMVDEIAEAARETIGEEKIIKMKHPRSGSDDFAEYLSSIPGVRFRVGSANDQPETKVGAHNPRVVFDEESLRVATVVICQYIFNLLR
ncbi:MAG: amidohydrolase [Lachnospiraceae bacterium]|nr:amidohydrolase [Lachnospiraceae bacterium]